MLHRGRSTCNYGLHPKEHRTRSKTPGSFRRVTVFLQQQLLHTSYMQTAFEWAGTSKAVGDVAHGWEVTTL